MGIIFLLVLVSALIAIFFLLAFIFSVKSGQFEDTDTPARRIILDDFKTKNKSKKEN